MFKQLVNECQIDLAIEPDGPILIKSGLATVSGPDMAFVRVWRNGTEEVYLPGSSLKGVLRSHAERIARTLRPDLLAIACDPFGRIGDEIASCGNCFNKRKQNAEIQRDHSFPDPQDEPDRLNPLVYRDSCPICRLFGSTWYAGRLATTDAYVEGTPPRPQQRDGVGINRFTGGAAAQVKFDLEVVTSGTFITSLHLRNFELWQLGLAGFLLQDLEDGLIRIGAGKSRGLGKVRGTVRQVKLHYLGREAPKPSDGQLMLCGVGTLVPDLTARYGMVRGDDDHTRVPFAGQWISNGVRTTYTFPSNTFPWPDIGQAWVTYATNYGTEVYPVAPEMSALRRRGKP